MADLACATASSDSDVLLQLAKQIGTSWGDLTLGLRHITEAATAALHVERCSIWLFEDEQRVIRLWDQYDRSLDRHTNGKVADPSDNPAYYRALLDTRVLAADEPCSDPITRAFAPLGISGVLDAPLRRQGQVMGIVCNDHLGAPRVWTDAERVVAASLADFAALVLEAAERRVAEESLRAREARLRAIMDNAYDVIVGMRDDASYYFLSPSATAVFGYPIAQLLAERGWPHMHPDDRGPVRAELASAFAERRPATASFRWLRPDGECRWFQAQGRPFEEDGEVRFVGVVRDVTDQRRAEVEARRRERQLAQAQKLEAVGQLAGGIAHDFNNVLTAILGHAEMALLSPSLDGESRAEISEIRRATQRGANLARQLLSLSSHHDAQPEVFDLDHQIETLARMLRRVIGDPIQCALRLNASPARVFIEPSRFDQVLINLAINARDAMPKGGTLLIETRRVAEPAAGACAAAPGAGPLVCVSVRDDGVGIPESLRSRIFDPFFSTKSPGQGTGLGLTMAYAIVKQAGGTIQVSSQVGVGTCFTILLPEAEAMVSAVADEATAAPATCRGSERILLVEDEWQLRHLLHRVLASHGYQVQVAADGDEGLEIAQHTDRPFDLLVSDVLMPGLSGFELAERVQKLFPGMPVLFLSAYASAPGENGARAPDPADILAKPFSPADLLERIRSVLERHTH